MMAGIHNNTLFGVCFLALICAVILIAPFEAPIEGKAYVPAKDKSLVPYVQLLSPDEGANLRSPVQEFLYEVHGVDYEVTCYLLLDEAFQESQTVSPGSVMKYSTSLDYGYHEWAVQCELLNGRTILSVEKSFIVKSYKSLGEDNQITGNVTGFRPSDAKGYMAVLVAIALLITGINLSREPKK